MPYLKPGKSFDIIERFMIAEYYGNSRKIQVRRLIESFILTSVMTEKGISSEQQAMTEIINTSDRLTLQFPPVF